MWSGSVSFKYRVEDPRLGRFFSLDPLGHIFNFLSPYHFSTNCPISTIELEGLEGYNAMDGLWNNTKKDNSAIAITKETYIRVKNWYATQGGTNNPDKLQIERPKTNYMYIFVPYDDPEHPEAIGQGTSFTSNDNQGRGPGSEQSSEMEGFYYCQVNKSERIITTDDSGSNDTSSNLSSNSSTTTDNIPTTNSNDPNIQATITPNVVVNAGILPFVSGGSSLGRLAMNSASQIPFINSLQVGRLNFNIENMAGATSPVNPTITIGVLRANGSVSIIGTFNTTGSVRFNLNSGDTLFYQSTGGNETIVTYTETR